MRIPTFWSRLNLITFIQSSIRNKIIIPYALLTLTLAALGAFVVTRLVAGSFQERFTNQLIDAGRIVSSEVVNLERLRLKVGRDVVNTIGVSDMAAQQDWEAVNNLIYPIMVTNSDIDSLLLVDQNADLRLQLFRDVQASDGVEVSFDSNINLSDWKAISEVLSDPRGDTKAVEIATDERSGQLIVYTASPLRIEPGNIDIVLIGTYLDSDLQILKDVAAADIILFSKPPDIMGSTISLNSVDTGTLNNLFTSEKYQEVLATGSDKTIFADFLAENYAYRLAYAPFLLQGKPYGVFAVVLSTNFVTETSALSRNTLATIFTIGMVVVLIVGYVVSQRIIHPVLRLVSVTQSVARGNLQRRTGLTGKDEVGVLAANFDNMTSKLEQKTIELEQEASKLNAILSSIADGVIVQDSTGNIITQNPAASNVLNRIGDDLEESSHGANNDDSQETKQSQDPLDILLTSITDLAYLEQRRLEIGERVLSALSAPVITSSEDELGSVVVLRDITQEVIAERLKDKFIQSVSHELKTPMFPLTGSISLIKMMLPMIAAQVPDKIFEKMTHNANVADEQANDLKNVVMAMVDLSEIDADNFAISRSTINMTDIVDQVGQDWFGPMEEKKLDFDISVPDEALWVNADEEKIRQVLKTLVRNAYLYSFEGELLLSLKKENEQAVLVVKDNGVGILEKDQPHLFTRFYRAIHDKKTFELSGIGLGLYLSKVIIERNEGEIWMESTPYQGSEFGFSLPIVPEPSDDDDDWDDWGDDDWGDESAAVFQ
ncbi:ATP-binding protein [Anaerolineales bacterium HSG24]|nr:ATP-binding protein [Anaerolineales bacterium HSG24]